VFCLEFLLENLSWLSDALQAEEGIDDDYIIFDCPGQIELYTHMNVMKRLVDTLQSWDFR
jgi:GTPase SAR1 family protein